MYLVNVYKDIAHKELVRADRYETIVRVAYYLGRDPSHLYNWMHRRTKPRGILKFVEINKC